VNHAGAVPFYSGLPTIDMAALNDIHIAQVAGRRHEKWDPGYVMGREPDFLVLNMRRKPVSGEYVPGYWGGETALVRHPDFKRYYVPAAEPWAWEHRGLEMRGFPMGTTSYIVVYRREEPRYERVGACQDFEDGYGSWQRRGAAFGETPATGAARAFSAAALPTATPAWGAGPTSRKGCYAARHSRSRVPTSSCRSAAARTPTGWECDY
jgi:hypothetical protein